ncbi:MAG: hypothetical protein AAB522_01470 [Patescibacteria group bacterium]
MKSKTWLVIIIIAVLAVIAWLAYSFRTVLIPSGAESVIKQLEIQGTSDGVADIEKDLKDTSLEGLDGEVSNIERELQSAGL